MVHPIIPVLLTVREVMHIYGISYSTVWRWVREGKLPEPIRLTKRKLRWPIEKIEEHLQKKTGPVREFFKERLRSLVSELIRELKEELNEGQDKGEE